jgi:aminopeptidase-like protein
MRYQTPRSLSAFCRNVLPVLQKAVNGQRILDDVAAIVATDRWNSFDRFHQTTETLVDRYERAGATVEVQSIQTGGRIGSGRWIIQEAQDIRSATVDVIHPIRCRVLDYHENPWHVVQWTSGTPENGLVTELVIIDTLDELGSIVPGALTGKMILTQLDPRPALKQLSATGAVGVISDKPITGHPDATAWIKFGWGGIPIENADVRLVGLVLSENGGRKLRAMMRTHGSLSLLTKVDTRRYVGTHDVVSGIVRGREDSAEEVWALAHSAEPGAIDNASGVAVCLEIARVIEKLIAAGRLPRPRRTIRLLHAYESYGFFHYLENVPRLQTPLAGVCIDSVGSRSDLCNGRLYWRSTIPMSAGFVDRIGAVVIRAALRLGKPGYRLAPGPFVPTMDTLMGDPRYGFPCPWINTCYCSTSDQVWNGYHSSKDTPDFLSRSGLSSCTAAMAGYLYYLANAGSREVMELAKSETDRIIQQLTDTKKSCSPADVRYLQDTHRVGMDRLKRWISDDQAVGILNDDERRVLEAVAAIPKKGRARKRLPRGARRVPRRLAPLAPTLENTPPLIAAQIHDSGLPAWALFWADGNRTLAEIADAVGCETANAVSYEQVAAFFEAHAALSYVELN